MSNRKSTPEIGKYIGVDYHICNEPIMLGDTIIMEDVVYYTRPILGKVVYDKAVCQYQCQDENGNRHIISSDQYIIRRWTKRMQELKDILSKRNSKG